MCLCIKYQDYGCGQERHGDTIDSFRVVHPQELEVTVITNVIHVYSL